MVGVNVRLDDPFELEAVVPDPGDHLIGVGVGDAAGRIVDVHDRIDDGAGVGCRILDDIADCVGVGIEERLHLGFDRHVHRIVRH